MLFLLSSLLLVGVNEAYIRWFTIENPLIDGACLIIWWVWLVIFMKVLKYINPKSMEWHPTLKNNYLYDFYKVIKKLIKGNNHNIEQSYDPKDGAKKGRTHRNDCEG